MSFLGFKIWERYFLREIAKGCLFFLFTFYGLYVLIDYASHTGSFHRQHAQWLEMVIYYSCEFVKRLEVLLPFSLLIATIRTLTNLNVHHELIALMSSGMSLQTLLRPFIIVGFSATCLVYFNSEFLLPTALRELKHIDANRAHKKMKYNKQAGVQHLVLEDQSTLLFEHYDPTAQKFLDAYWVRNIDDLYRIKALAMHANGTPIGYFVDHLSRNANGDLVVVESLPTMAFHEMSFNKQALFETITPPEEMSFSALWEKLPSSMQIFSEKDAQALSVFYHKLIMPWLCLFAVMGPAPFCVQISRHLPRFYIYAINLFGLVAIYLFMSAALLLGKRQALPPIWALWSPFALSSAAILYRYVRVR